MIGSGHLWPHAASLYTAASHLERVPRCLEPGQGPWARLPLAWDETRLPVPEPSHLASPDLDPGYSSVLVAISDLDSAYSSFLVAIIWLLHGVILRLLQIEDREASYLFK